MAHVLIVDDESSVLFLLREVLEERGHEVLSATSGVEARALADSRKLDEIELVLTDFAMPDLDGLGLMAHLRRQNPDLPVVLLTARGSERLAARAIKEGAFDYLPKPFELEELEAITARALETGSLRREARRAAAQTLLGRPFVGRAPAFRRVVDRALKLADRNVPVLVRGETGSGKELLASLLHIGGPRRGAPLVRFNCAAISAELAESELFGHARGAFTGANALHRGYFAQADGGTLVLDEVGELPQKLQPKLLRAVQFGEIQPVGGAIAQVDVRVVACTHRDLAAEVKAGRFREDLLYRLAVVELTMPPLRQRREDIALLAEVFARSAGERFGIEGVTLTGELLNALSAREYPGNVRELESIVTRLVALSDGRPLGTAALEEPGGAAPSAELSNEGSFRERVERLERSLLTEALCATAGNQSEAARQLGLSRVTFLDKLKRYGLVSRAR
ncbi:MAG TPA: sigma-54 dependent transcriptional regulator [Polyangiaceae bacterium]|nr:sigma-54 dependent transcriptional regulator [Polyangiaceae bacterium]